MIKKVKVGKFILGDGYVTVQSMLNAKTKDIEAVHRQLDRLKEAGCDIARIAVSNAEEANLCRDYIKYTDMPLVADIQYDYRLAIKCSDVGFAKVRFNPGNIGSDQNVAALVSACKANGTPVRIGVNGGSLQKDLLSVRDRAEALKISALKQVELLQKHDFNDIVISAKSSDVATTVRANRLLRAECDFPLHIGITESGDVVDGTINSAVGIGALLLDGIGETIRVSLSGDPVEEVAAAKKILRAVGLRDDYVKIVSCPTCSRCEYDLFGTVKEIKEFTKDIKKPIKVAIMGCLVNGPGEAADADFGVAGGKNKAALFIKGTVVKTITHDEIIPLLKRLIGEYNE